MVRNAQMASALGSKPEALDSKFLDSSLVFCLLELAMGVQKGSSFESCIMPAEINHDAT